MSDPKLRKKVLKNGEIMGPMHINGRDINFSNTSSYDSITEILSHAIRRSQPVEEYFKHNRAVKKAYQESSYATTVLNQAKRGPNIDSYKFRETFLYNNSDLARGRVSCFLQVPLGTLTSLLKDFVDVERIVKPCFSCIDEKWNFNIATRELGEIEKKIQEFFASKSKLCDKCRRKCEGFVDTLPLLSIATEHNQFIPFKCSMKKWQIPLGTHLNPTYCRNNEAEHESKSSLDILPVRLTIDDCLYLLCGVIGRTSLDGISYHYVAFCRNADGRWDKRDSFDEEIENLSEIPVVHGSQIFYVNVGYWDETERKSLIEPAKDAWYQVTKIELPELCLRGIFGYLDNEQLKFLIVGAEGLKN